MKQTISLPITLQLTEEDGLTKAYVVLDTGARTLRGHGMARCNPRDEDVPEVGDELAAGRALLDLAERLIQGAAADIQEIEGHPVVVKP